MMEDEMIGLIVFGCLFLVGIIITIIVMIAKYVEDGYCEDGTYIKYKTFTNTRIYPRFILSL